MRYKVVLHRTDDGDQRFGARFAGLLVRRGDEAEALENIQDAEFWEVSGGARRSNVGPRSAKSKSPCRDAGIARGIPSASSMSLLD